ncbi:MAG: alpha/beta hydrolase [Proteobacteria bacterium]|nr:alpha/beta hydrolase [Pseudomonadota bacterium]
MPNIKVNGTELFYERHGRGAPLLLIPGLGLDHTYYMRGEPILREHFETILVDPRGVGRSAKDLVEYTAELWADDYAALLSAIGVGNAHVIGSSLGGVVALAMAVRHPEAIASLAIIGGFSELTKSVEMNYVLRKKLIAKIGMGEEMAEFMALWIMTREFIESEEGDKVVQASKENVSKNSAELYVRFLDSILRLGRREPGKPIPALTASLGSIAAPTLVLCADNDHFIPSSLSKIIAAQISDARYAEIANGGHIPFVEKPAESAAAVVEFIQSLGVGAGAKVRASR